MVITPPILVVLLLWIAFKLSFAIVHTFTVAFGSISLILTLVIITLLVSIVIQWAILVALQLSLVFFKVSALFAFFIMLDLLE